MKNNLKNSLFVLMAVLGASACKTTEHAQATEHASTSSSVPVSVPHGVPSSTPADFNFKLYSAVAAKSGNFMVSPSSMGAPLRMVAAGAKENTLKELQVALGAPIPAEDSVPLSEVAMTNHVWVDQSVQLLPSFTSALKKNFSAEATQVDFHGHPEVARKQINQSIEAATEGRIKDLVPAPVSSMRLMLTNAVYFRARWAKPFQKFSTRNEDFQVAGGKAIKVPFMHQTEVFSFSRDTGLTMLELAYGPNEKNHSPSLAMDVILPEKGTSLSDLEHHLTQARFDRLIDGLSVSRVDVALPQFHAQTTIQGKPVLQSLGIRDAFSSKADFSGIDGQRDLQISEVIQKTFIKVDEEGTEAAAATVLGMRSMALHTMNSEIFHANRPFIYVIRALKSGEILFMGRVANPKL